MYLWFKAAGEAFVVFHPLEGTHIFFVAEMHCVNMSSTYSFDSVGPDV